MPFLDTIFGRKRPTAAAAETAIAKLEAELEAVPVRLAGAQAALRRVADLSDDEHAAAEAELAGARRAETRLKAQIEQLRAAHERAVKNEAAAALRARAAAVQKRLDTEMAGLIARYEAKAAEIAEIAGSIKAIDDEVAAVNRVVQAKRREEPEADLPAHVVTSHERFRSEPDVKEPDTTIVEEKWEEVDPQSGFWVGAGVLGRHHKTGEMVPVNAGARKRQVERVIPGKVRKGRSLPCPIYYLSLPAARLDGPSFWPRAR